MSPSCSLTSAHFLLLPICFIDFRQVCNERISGSLLSHIPKPLRGRESETSPWGSQARRKKPPLQLCCAHLPGSSAVVHVFKQIFVVYPPSWLTHIWYLYYDTYNILMLYCMYSKSSSGQCYTQEFGFFFLDGGGRADILYEWGQGGLLW